MWSKCYSYPAAAIPGECLNPVESGEAGPVVLELFLKLFLRDSHCFTLRVTRGPNAEC